MSARFARSPLSTELRDGGQATPLWQEELRDLSRGLCGALFVALPLHYTEEMWLHARRIPWALLLLAVGVTYLANVGYQAFEGYKGDARQQNLWFDALTAMGIGALGSALTMLLAGRYTPDMPVALGCRLILMETTITSFGASLAINQLGARGGRQGRTLPGNRLPAWLRMALATLLGALLFSYNIAPTIEPTLIATSIGPWHLVGLLLFSLTVSVLMTYFSDFVERRHARLMDGQVIAETVAAYLISLVVSAVLLAYFGYLGSLSAADALSRIIVLGYATTVGGAAGRLII